MNKNEVINATRNAKSAKNLTWQQIADHIGRSPVWTTSACLGENSMPATEANKLCALLDLPSDVSASLQSYPIKSETLDIPKDPLIYRFHEITLVYGTTLKELIHEKTRRRYHERNRLHHGGRKGRRSEG